MNIHWRQQRRKYLFDNQLMLYWGFHSNSESYNRSALHLNVWVVTSGNEYLQTIFKKCDNVMSTKGIDDIILLQLDIYIYNFDFLADE